MATDGNFAQSGRMPVSNSPHSDIDPYATGDGMNQGPNPPNSPYAKYPTKVNIPPFGFMQTLLFLSEKNYESMMARKVCLGLDQVGFLLNRWPTQEETDCYVSISNTRNHIEGLGPQLGGAMGLAYLIRRKPVNTTTGTASLGQFFSHHLRTIPFGRAMFVIPLSLVLGNVCGGLLSAFYETSRSLGDPRMAELKEAFQQRPQEMLDRLKRFRAQQFNMARAPRSQSSDQSTAPLPVRDDASPTAGGFASDLDQGYGGQQSPSREDSKMLDAGYQRQGQVDPYQYHQRPQQQQPQQPQQQQQYNPIPGGNDQGTGFFDDDNDSSASNRASAPKPSGSAWARIRQSTTGNPSESQPRSPQSQQQSAQSDSFNDVSSSSFRQPSSAFQDSSQDTNREKDRAQREFDRLLERERNLGSSGSGAAENSERPGGAWGRRW